MDKEHVAAAIERFIEEVRMEQRVHEIRADDCRMQAQELSKIRAAAEVNYTYLDDVLKYVK